jgi:hypothetical protein
VAGDWRRLHNEELHNLYASLYINREINSRRIRWARHLLRMGEMRSAYNISVGKPEGKTLRSLRRRLEDNIKMDIREIGWEYGDRIHLAQNRDQWRDHVNTAMNLRIP